MELSAQLRKSTAFIAACLVVVWVGGSFLTAMFKVAYWLWFGAWPYTQLYGLLPEAWTPSAASILRHETLPLAWNFVLRCDVIMLLLVVPPLLLLPCLFLMRTDHGGIIPALRSTTKPFGPATPMRSPDPYPSRPPCVACTMKNRA